MIRKLQRHIQLIPYEAHLVIATLIRISLIIYGERHDIDCEVPYTDVDYYVVTDGARHILDNCSPFKRHTFRYSPLLAILLTPNIWLHKSFGKVLFCAFDICVGVLIKKIICNELRTTYQETAKVICKRLGKHHKSFDDSLPERYEQSAQIGALFWLYNPLTMAISTRGNGDSISSLLILGTLYFLQKYKAERRHSFYAGLCHGIAIHIRLYPVIFSLAYYLSLLDYRYKERFIKRLFPNNKQIFLMLGTVLSFTTLTGMFYNMYGWEFLYEAYLYHFIRKDTKHNFSLYFLMQYLNTENPVNLVQKLLTVMPQLIIIMYFSLSLGRHLKTLSFCVFGLTYVIVTYNTVITSQYFVWYLALMPLCLRNFSNISKRLAVTYFSLWGLAQALWLLPAYLLEFKTINTFNFIGIQSIAFFFVNIFIIQRFITYYDVISRIK